MYLRSHDFASKSEACQHAGQEPSAEAPPAVGEHVEDVAPAHERAWAPSRQDPNDFTTMIVMACNGHGQSIEKAVHAGNPSHADSCPIFG